MKQVAATPPPKKLSLATFTNIRLQRRFAAMYPVRRRVEKDVGNTTHRPPRRPWSRLRRGHFPRSDAMRHCARLATQIRTARVVRFIPAVQLPRMYGGAARATMSRDVAAGRRRRRSTPPRDCPPQDGQTAPNDRAPGHRCAPTSPQVARCSARAIHHGASAPQAASRNQPTRGDPCLSSRQSPRIPGTPRAIEL